MNSSATNAVLDPVAAHAPVALRMLDSEGQCIYANAAWWQLIRAAAAPEQDVRHGLINHVGETDAPRVISEWDAAIGGGKDFEIAYSLRCDDGFLLPVVERFAPAERPGQWAAACIPVARPAEETGVPGMSERRFANRKVARSCSSLFGVVAHDLRSPLNSIQSWSSVLEAKVLDAPAVVHRAIAGIKTSVLKQVDMIDEFMHALQVMEGRVEISSVPVSIDLVVLEVLGQLGEALQERSLQVESDLSTGEARVMGDPALLKSAISRVLSICMKVSGSGELIHLRTWHADGEVWLSITDHGPSLTVEGEQFFDAFIDRSMQRRGRFSGGMSAAVARELVEQQGGRLSVANVEEGPGATFLFALPATANAAL